LVVTPEAITRSILFARDGSTAGKNHVARVLRRLSRLDLLEGNFGYSGPSTTEKLELIDMEGKIQ
jgi:hypothetical protein